MRKVNDDYINYMEMLSCGNVYRITISKWLLFRPLILIWSITLAVFLIPNSVFFQMVGIPWFVICAVILVMLYPYFEACAISKRGYVLFHISAIIICKIFSLLILTVLGVVWG